MTVERVPLSVAQQELVLSCEVWLVSECCRCTNSRLRYRLGMDVVIQEGWLAVCKAAADYDTNKHPGVPFGAFARRGVRIHLRGVAEWFSRSTSVWNSMPDEDLVDRMSDNRSFSVSLLSLWHDDEYSHARRVLDMRSRVILYLLIVESWTMREIAEILGISYQRVRHLRERAENRLTRVIL